MGIKLGNKKGEITTSKIVTIILLVLGFGIALYFWFTVNLGNLTDEQICHNSVIQKATGQGIVGKLDCRTQYICISGGGECEGINPSDTISVDAGNKEEIMKAIADEMATCWWMFGEGQADYIGFGSTSYIGSTACAACSIIKFDNNIQERSYIIPTSEFWAYLNSIKKGDSQTYFSYIYPPIDINYALDYADENNFKLRFDGDTYLVMTGMTKDPSLKGIGIWEALSEKNYILPAFGTFEETSLNYHCSDFVTKST